MIFYFSCVFHYLSIHNNAEKHCCCKVKDKRFLELTYFPFLAAGKIITNTGGLPDVPAEHKATMYKKIIYVDIKLLRLHVDHEVENSEKGKGKDVHEDQVEPGYIHLPAGWAWWCKLSFAENGTEQSKIPKLEQLRQVYSCV